MPVMYLRSAARPLRAAGMRGMSLVELMVGVAVGLFVVAAATLLVSSQLSDNRRLLLETQLQQDLRATADIVTRELRRSSYWGSPQSSVPMPDGGSTAPNPNLMLTLPGGAGSPLLYTYKRTGAESFGFRLDADGVIRSCQSDLVTTAGGCDGGYQEMTDPNTVNITAFAISSVRAGARARTANDTPITLPCVHVCADGTSSCWPTVGVREVVITITGQSRTDATVVRTLNTSVRIRTDRVDLSSEAGPGQACPSS